MGIILRNYFYILLLLEKLLLLLLWYLFCHFPYFTLILWILFSYLKTFLCRWCVWYSITSFCVHKKEFPLKISNCGLPRAFLLWKPFLYLLISKGSNTLEIQSLPPPTRFLFYNRENIKNLTEFLSISTISAWLSDCHNPRLFNSIQNYSFT